MEFSWCPNDGEAAEGKPRSRVQDEYREKLQDRARWGEQRRDEREERPREK